MYDHDRDDIDVLGWEEFILRQWESIFLGYRSTTAIRTVGRRWCDLIEAGIGCSQAVADELVRTEIIDREDRRLADADDSSELLAEMADVLDDLPDALRRLPRIPPDQLAELIERHARLVEVLVGVTGDEDAEASASS